MKNSVDLEQVNWIKRLLKKHYTNVPMDRTRKRWKELSKRVTSQQKSKLQILEIKKYFIVRLGKWN